MTGGRFSVSTPTACQSKCKFFLGEDTISQIIKRCLQFFIQNVIHSIKRLSGRHKANTVRPKSIGKENNKSSRNVKTIRLISLRNYVILCGLWINNWEWWLKWKKIQKRRDMYRYVCVCVSDSLDCMVETNTTFYTLYSNKN